MRRRLLLPATLSLALCGLACGGGGSAAPPYLEPREPRISCPAPVLLDGGLSPAADPGAACLGAPRPSALPAAGLDGPQGWLDLGAHRVGEVVDVPVPAGTASLLLMEQLVRGGPPGQKTVITFTDSGTTQTQDNVAVIGELHDPGGRLVYTDLEVISGSDFSGALLFAAGAGAVVGSVAYPSTSAGLQAIGAGGVAPGTWRVLVNDYGYECWLASQQAPPPGLAGISCDAASRTDDAVYRVYALTTPVAAPGGSSAIRATGTLDVAFHLVDAPTPLIGITAAQAPTHPALRRMVESFGWLLSGAGICLGSVTFYDEQDWARARFATGTSADDQLPCGNLPQLLATSRPGARTLELFLVPRLNATATDTGVVVGVDGTIPGPATVNGTISSGGVVSAEDLGAGTCPLPGGTPVSPPRPAACGQDRVAYIAAHEAGHFLGLYHPSEAGGDLFDPLSDTPRCECTSRCGFTPASCAQGVTPSRCVKPDPTCAGGTNLMFWQLGSVSAGHLSPEQARIVRSSPVVRSP